MIDELTIRDFDAFTLVREVAGRERTVVLMPDLLRLWWSASDGPQTAEGLANQSLKTTDQMILLQIRECTVDASDDAPIVLTSFDYEGEGPEFSLTGPLG